MKIFPTRSTEASQRGPQTGAKGGRGLLTEAQGSGTRAGLAGAL